MIPANRAAQLYDILVKQGIAPKVVLDTIDRIQSAPEGSLDIPKLIQDVLVNKGSAPREAFDAITSPIDFSSPKKAALDFLTRQGVIPKTIMSAGDMWKESGYNLEDFPRQYRQAMLTPEAPQNQLMDAVTTPVRGKAPPINTDYVKRLYDSLIANGFTPKGAMVAVANGAHETAGFTQMTNKSSGAAGAFHFLGPRKEGLWDYAKEHGLDPMSPEAGAGYLGREVNDPKHRHIKEGLIGKLESFDSLDKGTQYFSENVERAGVPKDLGSRLRYLRGIQDMIGWKAPQQAAPQPAVAQAAPASVMPTSPQVLPDPYNRDSKDYSYAANRRNNSEGPPKPDRVTLAGLLKDPANAPLEKLIALKNAISGERPPGYGDNSHMKAGYAGMTNPDYWKTAQQGMGAQGDLASLMQMVMMGGRQA